MKNRIEYREQDSELEVTIKALKDEKKQKMLLLWIVLFSICGVLIFTQFFWDYDQSSKIFFAVYMAFWLFFEFKVIYAYRWRNKGRELIIINQNELILVKEIGKRGITQKFNLNEINDLGKFKNDDNPFLKAMYSSYWNINKYTLSFFSNHLLIPFAIDLLEKESEKLLKKIKGFIDKVK